MPLEPLRRTLSNGITVLVKETTTTPAVTILVGARAGAYYDPIGYEGTAALAARVLDRGTESRSADAISDELDGRGASLSVMAGRHQVTVSATCLTEDFDAIIELAADVVRRPLFDENEVRTRRAELVTSILQDEDDPAAVSVDHLMSRLFANHPYGRRARGTMATVGQIGREDLIKFHSDWYSPSGTILVVVGDVDPEYAAQAAARCFESWTLSRRYEEPVSDAPHPTQRQLYAVPMMNKAQADIAYGFIGMRRSDPDYYAAWVMNNALGQYALGGRLGDSIREKQGMAYYVYSSLDPSLAAGPLMVRAGIAGGDVERTIASIDRELKAVRTEGITQKELDESKRYLIGSIPRQLETNAGIAGFLLSVEFFELGSDYETRLPSLIADVTLDDANAQARRLLDPERATIVVAGPWQGAAGAEIISASVSDVLAQPALIQSKSPS